MYFVDSEDEFDFEERNFIPVPDSLRAGSANTSALSPEVVLHEHNNETVEAKDTSTQCITASSATDIDGSWSKDILFDAVNENSNCQVAVVPRDVSCSDAVTSESESLVLNSCQNKLERNADLTPADLMEKNISLSNVQAIKWNPLHAVEESIKDDGPLSLPTDFSSSSRNDWVRGVSLAGDLPSRCSSAQGSYSGRSTPVSSSLRAGRSTLSLSSLHQQRMHSSQLLQELRQAALQGRPDAVTSVLKTGVCVDQTLRQGWTALMFACSAAQVEVVKLLLDNKADPNFHKELFTPLMAACASSVRDKNISTVGRHENNERNDNDSNVAGNDDAASNVIEGAVGSSTVATTGSEARLLVCVDLLLRYGANVNAAERHKITPLMFASKEGRSALVRRLLRSGAVPNARDNKGWTSLCWACHGGHAACVQELLAASADAVISTERGQTAADIARAQHHFKLAEIVEAAALGTPISVPESMLSNSSSPSQDAPQQEHCSDLDMVLAGLGLSHLSPLFAKHKIDLVGFLRLSAGELSDLGVGDVGVQHKLLSAIAEMHRKAWQPSSIAPLSSAPYISLTDAMSMIGNVNKHVSFLEATLAFLRQQLESSASSEHLHHNTTNCSIQTLISSTQQAAASINRLHSTTLFLTAHLQKISEDASLAPSDLLVASGPDAPRVWVKTVGAGAAAGALLIAALWWLRPSLVSSLAAVAEPRAVLLDCN
ncbi:ankyrin repeat, SAM and basic leucine zipper domain-containing protein 1 [Hyalella azteca]|uniref:Ankyrin repeat, SAM and basic leucine zipper domain-containing protein 1 n=1 Tax=Hyalella azteca TaxID=294128 RepID=A0A8B7N3T3_HYAAZ|nr:ankyrin repeat, SAM and basic leucine zipper domain-containing protein 1 [Hyalella azteca]